MCRWMLALEKEMPKMLAKFRPLTFKTENAKVLKKIDFGLMSVSPEMGWACGAYG